MPGTGHVRGGRAGPAGASSGRVAAVDAAIVEEFARNAEAAGFRVHRGAAPELPGAGVSRAVYGLADTGSVVLAASAEEPRARSLLPEVHVSLLAEDRILPGLAELFAAVGAQLPSALAIVTGPSRSADIEQKLAIGVHGPGEVHVVLVPPGGIAAGRRSEEIVGAARKLEDSGRREDEAEDEQGRPQRGADEAAAAGCAGQPLGEQAAPASPALEHERRAGREQRRAVDEPDDRRDVPAPEQRVGGREEQRRERGEESVVERVRADRRL